MASDFQFGMLTVSSAVIIAALALVLAWRGVSIRWLVLPTVLIALLVARLAHVISEWDGYTTNPLSALYLGDGGWIPAAGVAAAFLYALYWSVRRPVQRRVAVGVVLVTGTLWLTGTAAIYAAPQQSDLPKLSLRDLQGRTVDLSRLKGQPVVLNVWATWCPPCRKEMPILHEAQQKYQDVKFLFMNAGETPDKVSQYLEEHKLELRNVLLDQQLEAKSVMGNRGLPTTFFYGSDGRMISTRVGELTRTDLENRLERLRAETKRVGAAP